MASNLKEQIKALNQSNMELMELYRNYAEHCGVSENTMWVLHSILESNAAITQTELCQKMSSNKQLIDSTLNNLEEEGYIRLVPRSNVQGEKEIILTEAGLKLLLKTVFPLKAAEQVAFAELTEEEREAYLCLVQKHIFHLHKEIDRALNSDSENFEPFYDYL